MKTERIIFRVTAEEKKTIEEKAGQAEMTISSYVAYAALQQEIMIIDGVDNVAYQLSKIGGNLNQLTKKCNEGILKCVGLHDTKNELMKMYECLTEICKQSRTRERMKVLPSRRKRNNEQKKE